MRKPNKRVVRLSGWALRFKSWLSHRVHNMTRRQRIISGSIAGVLVLTAVVPTVLQVVESRRYQLDGATRALVGNVNSNLAAKLTYDSKESQWQFNKTVDSPDSDLPPSLTAQAGGGGKDDESLYRTDFPTDPKKGVTFTDTQTELAFTMTPEFKLYSGRVYTIGGTTLVSAVSTSVDTIQYATINTNGTLGTWTLNPTNFPNQLANQTAATYNGTVYIIGNSGGGATNRVQRAPVNSDGTLGSWTWDGSGSSNNGTMTSSVDLTNRMNYYKWTTAQGSNQNYDVVVQIPIPTDFDGWSGSNPLSISTYTSNTTNGTITLEARDSSNGVQCNFVSVTPGSTGTWATNNSACTLSSGTYTAGDYMTLRMRMQSPNGGDVRIGNINLNYLSKY